MSTSLSSSAAFGTFRYHDDGRLAEEWVQTDYRSLPTELGVTTTESAERRTP